MIPCAMVTNKDIYDSALRMLAESCVEGDNDDYEERAPYLLAAFCTEAEDTDKALRQILSEPEGACFNAVYVPLNEQFPLLDRFSAAAAFYLAAMLVIDDNRELSDTLYDKYSDSMSRLCASVPALSGSISDRYYFS